MGFRLSHEVMNAAAMAATIIILVVILFMIVFYAHIRVLSMLMIILSGFAVLPDRIVYSDIGTAFNFYSHPDKRKASELFL